VKTGIDPFAILAPPILTLIVIVLGYSQSRRIRGGKPLSSIQRKMLFYFAFFVLGMGYAIMLSLAEHLDRRDGRVGCVVGGDSLGRSIEAIRFEALTRQPQRDVPPLAMVAFKR
jgi:hypothetical protein